MVAGSGEQIVVIPLDRLRETEVGRTTFVRPSDFSLPEFWRAWSDLARRQRPFFIVRALVTEPLLLLIDSYIRELASVEGNDSWQYVLLEIDTFEAARTQILGWGGATKVLHPEDLRLSVADFARRILQVYNLE